MTVEYLLDTGVLNAYLRGRAGAVALVDPWVVQGQAATSVLVYGEIVEFLQGLADGDRREAELCEVLRDVHPYQLTETGFSPPQAAGFPTQAVRRRGFSQQSVASCRFCWPVREWLIGHLHLANRIVFRRFQGKSLP